MFSGEAHGYICVFQLGRLDAETGVSEWPWRIATHELVTAGCRCDTHHVRVDVRDSMREIEFQSSCLPGIEGDSDRRPRL